MSLVVVRAMLLLISYNALDGVNPVETFASSRGSFSLNKPIDCQLLTNSEMPCAAIPIAASVELFQLLPWKSTLNFLPQPFLSAGNYTKHPVTHYS
ncbi:MAG: hypothetical protein EAZ77_19095 [Nostocales cyanobacterium]|nr:MAG: hypothetical protein EAZ77_19095 [Nostocales cyanobacterium]